MNDKLRKLESELKEYQAMYEKARDAKARTSRELDTLLKSISTLSVEDVPAFVAKRNELQGCCEIYNRIATDRLERCDQLQAEIREAKLQEIVAAKDEKGAKYEAIMQRLPFLAINDPERKDLQAELDVLRS
jgi:phage-related minor tail protein